MVRLVTPLALTAAILQMACTRTVVVRSTVPVEVAWVCHGQYWLEVAATQAEAHERHGDWISLTPKQHGAACEGLQPPQPPPPPERREPQAPPPQLRIGWVCHGEVDARWLRVQSDPVLDTHRRHGDPISLQPQNEGAPCTRAAERPPAPTEPRRPSQPQPPPEPQVAWVCHGDENARWIRVPPAAAGAHLDHGDPVSSEPQQPGTPCERGQPEPQEPERPQQPPERRRPTEPGQPSEPGEPQVAWVCHGDENARWIRVPPAAVEAHVGHGDPVATEPQQPGTPCERGQPEPQEPERPQQPKPPEPRRPSEPDQPSEPRRPSEPGQPGSPQFVWVCHGEQDPRWLRVAAPAVDAHRQHGDPVSTEDHERGAACNRAQPEEPNEPRQPSEPRRPSEPGEPREPGQPQFVWVCHGPQNPTWLRVAASAGDAHRRHGDPVSTEEKEEGTACERGDVGR